MDVENAIIVEHVNKIYKLYQKPQDRIKEVFSLTGKQYHTEFSALSDISFCVKKGETLGIIGRNGAGKSTLLKLITGVATPTQGNIQVNGQVSALLELGTGFNPEYTGYQNIYLNGTMRGYSKEQMDSKVEEILAFADIGDYIMQPVKTYSSGMFARLAFAVMISFRPEILIIDEALSVGDVFFQQKCNTFMKEKLGGVTKLLVTHDMNSIANMADRVILLDHGRIVQEGPPLEVIENYLKLMQNEVFMRGNTEREEAVSANECNEKSSLLLEKKGWHTVPQEAKGGAMDVEIEEFKVLVNGCSSDVAKTEDEISIGVVIHSHKNCENIILGYTFKDKYGNSIFAQNTVGAGIRVDGVSGNNSYMLSFCFKWPQVKEGDYFLTLGIGEGEDQMVHVIQCWAHNVAHIQGISTVPMHGVINHVIDDFKVKRL